MTNNACSALLCSALLCESIALAQPLAPNVMRAVESVRRDFPGVRCFEDRGKVIAVYGVPMQVGGETPLESVETWFGVYGDVFGDPRPNVSFSPAARLLSKGKVERAVVSGVQYVDGRPVVGAVVRALCVRRNGVWSPVYVAMKVADAPHGGVGDPKIGAGQALAIVAGHPGATNLAVQGAPALEVRFDDLSSPRTPARLTWSVLARAQGEHPSLEDRVFRVDAVTGEVWRIDGAVVPVADITGTVTGWATPGTRPDGGCPTPAPNDPVEMPLPMVKVTALSGSTPVASAFTDLNGAYTLLTGAGTYTIRMELVGPNWEVLDGSSFPPAPGLALEYPSVPNGTVRDGVFNASPSEHATAQVNGHLNVARARQFFLSRIQNEAEWVDGFETPLNVVVNALPPSFCGFAGYDESSDSIVFGQACGQSANFAYSTVVAHEYGHFVGQRVFQIDKDSDPAWHEGFGDCVSHLLFDTRVIGEEYAGCGTFIRDPEDPVATFPVCNGGAHVRGTVLSGTFWDIREAIGLSGAQQLLVDWAALATGDRPDAGGCPSPVSQAADWLTLEQVLIADDDDGDLSNGTPNIDAICEAFQNHGITGDYCGESAPASPLLDWDRPGDPTVLDVVGFLTAAQARDPRADANGDGAVDVVDLLWYLARLEMSAGAKGGVR